MASQSMSSCLRLPSNFSSKTHFGLNSKPKISIALRGSTKFQRTASFSIRAMGSSASSSPKPDSTQEAGKMDYSSISDEEWKKKITGEQFYITRQKGTERAFTGYNPLLLTLGVIRPVTTQLGSVRIINCLAYDIHGDTGVESKLCSCLPIRLHTYGPAVSLLSGPPLDIIIKKYTPPHWLRLNPDYVPLFIVAIECDGILVAFMEKSFADSKNYMHARKALSDREYWNTKTPGTYHCICCGTPLYESSTKFDSGTGWPSYYEPIGNNVKSKLDLSIIFVPRQEVLCATCGAHLGHVFDDGPPPTGKRHCINSASLKLKPK